jgi:hypothetical protein
MAATVKSKIYRYNDIGNIGLTLDQLLNEPEKVIKNNIVFEGKGNIRVAVILLYMFEFDGFLNYALTQACGGLKVKDKDLSIKERIKKIYKAKNRNTDVCGGEPFQSLLTLFKLRNSFVHPKIEEDDYIDNSVDGLVSSENLSEHLTGNMLNFSNEALFLKTKSIIEDATNKIISDCNINLLTATTVSISSG